MKERLRGAHSRVEGVLKIGARAARHTPPEPPGCMQGTRGNTCAPSSRSCEAQKPPGVTARRERANEARVRRENDDGYAPRKMMGAHAALVAARGRGRSARGGRGVEQPRATSGGMACLERLNWRWQ